MKTIENNKNEVGLYRQVGNNDLVTELTAKVKSSEALTSQDVMDWEAGSVHIACTAVSRTLRSHAPLVPYDKFDALIACKTVEAAKKAMAPTSALFDAFVLHLAKIAANEAVNKMGKTNLGTTIGNACFRANENDPTDLAEASKEAKTKAAVFALILDGITVLDDVPTLQTPPKKKRAGEDDKVEVIEGLDDGWDDDNEEEDVADKGRKIKDEGKVVKKGLEEEVRRRARSEATN